VLRGSADPLARRLSAYLLRLRKKKKKRRKKREEAMFTREKRGHARLQSEEEKKRINDFSSFSRWLLAAGCKSQEARRTPGAEMKSSSISFESRRYDKFVLMTRHVFRFRVSCILILRHGVTVANDPA
jgi:hypothetical protein